jgi:hypothetical protein
MMRVTRREYDNVLIAIVLNLLVVAIRSAPARPKVAP